MTCVPKDAETLTGDAVLDVEVVAVGGHHDGRHRALWRVLRVCGEVDLATAHRLAAALDAELGNHPGPLVLDVTAMTFCGAAGLTAIANSVAGAAEHQVDYAVAGLAPRLVGLYAQLWPAPHPDHYIDLETALTALGDGDPGLLLA